MVNWRQLRKCGIAFHLNCSRLLLIKHRKDFSSASNIRGMLPSTKLVEWLNTYHEECREKVGALLLQQGHKEAYNWLMKETEPIG